MYVNHLLTAECILSTVDAANVELFRIGRNFPFRVNSWSADLLLLLRGITSSAPLLKPESDRQLRGHKDSPVTERVLYRQDY